MIIHRKKPTRSANQRNYTHPEKPRYAHLEMCAPPAPRDVFKIVSYNIKYSKKITGAIKLLSTHEELKDCDIICLQEMTSDAVVAIATGLQYNYVFYPAVLHPVLGKDFGNAILTRWPIVKDEKVIIPHMDPRKSQRALVNATVKINNKHVVVSCVHLKVLMKPTNRGEQTVQLLSSLPKRSDHFIIAGDFNTFSKANNRAILEPFIEADFIPATAGLGWSHKHWTLLNKKTQLDHIFVKGLSILRTGKVLDSRHSDHLPIWAELTFDDISK